jgi:hypothetical protein
MLLFALATRLSIALSIILSSSCCALSVEYFYFGLPFFTGVIFISGHDPNHAWVCARQKRSSLHLHPGCVVQAPYRTILEGDLLKSRFVIEHRIVVYDNVT